MDPLTIGILVGVAASSAAAALGWRGGRRGQLPPDEPKSVAAVIPNVEQGGIRVGDVLTYLGDEYWLAGELALMREGRPAVRIFTAPERGGDRWVAIPRDGRSVWVLFANADLKALGWPGVEVPAGGRILRRFEHGNAAIVPGGEGLGEWEGMGRFALFRAHDGVAVVVEAASKQRLALVGREIPKELVQKMG